MEQVHHATNLVSPQSSSSYQPIEDYGIIGDLHTVALVGKNGSIDWCCIPCFDSPSVFGALLDARKGGFFRIGPRDMPDVRHKQMYVPETNILLTRFLAVSGVGEIIDFMPLKKADTAHKQYLIRSVSVVRGTMEFIAIMLASMPKRSVRQARRWAISRKRSPTFR